MLTCDRKPARTCAQVPSPRAARSGAAPPRPLQDQLLPRWPAATTAAPPLATSQDRRGYFHEPLFPLQREPNGQAGPAAAPPVVHEALRSSGEPLDRAARAVMEPRFGCDLGGVRVHTNALAAESAQAVHALAYTVGSNVVFGSGQYAPHTPAGQRLLAHELAHVVQQRGVVARAPLALGPADDPFEHEAARAADGPSGAPASLGRDSASMIRREGAGSAAAQEAAERRLRSLAARPSEAIQAWKSLKQAERDMVFWNMANRYSLDFSSDFLKYAGGEKKPRLWISTSNDPALTPESLASKGYRSFDSDRIWVHPSGHEFHLLATKAVVDERRKAEEARLKRCEGQCTEEPDEKSCKTCCEKTTNDDACRQWCEAGCFGAY